MSADLIDRSQPIREGEQLDLDKLGPYVASVLGKPGASVSVEQFPGGHSNLTYLVRCGDEKIILRRPPFGSKVKTAHDMGREYRVLSKLAPVYARAPKPLSYCEDESLIGCRFYLVERVRGLILRKTVPAGLTLDQNMARSLCDAFVDTIVDLHAIDYKAIGLGDFGKPDGYVARQVHGWTKRYRGSQTDDVPAVDEVAKWLVEHMPQSNAATIIHNDYKFDNLVLAPNDIRDIIGILDWEMCTIGDPLMDLGTSLSYWIEHGDSDLIKDNAFGPTMIGGMLRRQELAEKYGERSKRDISKIVFYYCFGLFKTAVIVQQIHYRYAKALTQDPRFGSLQSVMKMLIARAATAIERDSISP